MVFSHRFTLTLLQQSLQEGRADGELQHPRPDQFQDREAAQLDREAGLRDEQQEF